MRSEGHEGVASASSGGGLRHVHGTSNGADGSTMSVSASRTRARSRPLVWVVEVTAKWPGAQTVPGRPGTAWTARNPSKTMIAGAPADEDPEVPMEAIDFLGVSRCGRIVTAPEALHRDGRLAAAERSFTIPARATRVAFAMRVESSALVVVTVIVTIGRAPSASSGRPRARAWSRRWLWPRWRWDRDRRASGGRAEDRELLGPQAGSARDLRGRDRARRPDRRLQRRGAGIVVEILVSRL